MIWTKVFYWFYLNLIRKWSSPLLYWIISSFSGGLPSKWEEIKNYDRDKFEKVINQYEYKWDGKGGWLDFSSQNPDFFFIKKKYFRDCDDFARMWYWWAIENNYKAWEVCIWEGFKKAHFITVFKDENKYQVCNYRLRGEYNSLEEAIKSVKGFDNYLIYKKSGD